MIELFNKKNNKSPKIIQVRGILLVFFVALFVEFLFFSEHTGRISFDDLLADISSSELVELTNTKRVEEDINTLEINPRLTGAAKMKAEHMAEEGYFAHTSPDGIDPWHWFDEAGYEYKHAGENLAVNFSESDQVDEAWMNSPKHRKNIINEEFEDVGIATAKGEYKGEEAVFVVQLFGEKTESKTPIFRRTKNNSDQDEEEFALKDDKTSEQEDKKINENNNQQTNDLEEESVVMGDESGDQLQKENSEDYVQDNQNNEEDFNEDKKKSPNFESFAFLEEREDGPRISFIGTPGEFTIIEDDLHKEYVSFWGRLKSSPLSFIALITGLFLVTTLISFTVKKLFMKNIYIPNVLINQLIILAVILSALLIEHSIFTIL